MYLHVCTLVYTLWKLICIQLHVSLLLGFTKIPHRSFHNKYLPYIQWQCIHIHHYSIECMRARLGHQYCHVLWRGEEQKCSVWALPPRPSAVHARAVAHSPPTHPDSSHITTSGHWRWAYIVWLSNHNSLNWGHLTISTLCSVPRVSKSERPQCNTIALFLQIALHQSLKQVLFYTPQDHIIHIKYTHVR